MRSLQQLVAITVLASLIPFHHVLADTRPAEEILKDHDSVVYPAFEPSKREDEEYIARYRAQREEADALRAAFILKLYEAHPDHERLEKLMPTRWQMLMYSPDHKTTLEAEMETIIAANPKSKLAGEARYFRAQSAVTKAIYREEPDLDAAEQAIDVFIAAAPEDDRAARLLGMLADAHKSGSAEQLAVFDRILSAYPKSGTAKYVTGRIRQVKGIGQPFELSFTDAITERTIDMKELQGQVVVVDFWATWCGPCVAEMPHMKELYAKYHEKGVEFIGVSLDQPEDKGGLEKLRTFVKEKELDWPQYYQGKGWESDFSVSWGINGIPTLFIVDKQGNLHSTEARGKLDELIPKLLAE